MAANFSNDSIELDNDPDRPTNLPKNPSTKNANDKNNKASPTAKTGRVPSSSSSPSKVSNNSSKANNAKNVGTSRTNVPAKKTTRANLQNRSPDELYSEIVELKKALTIEKDDNVNLKNKLRRSEDENNRKIESSKTAGLLAVNTLKRKVQRLEQMVKEKDNQLKKMQTSVQTSKLQVDTKKPETSVDGATKGRLLSSSGSRDPSKPSTSRAAASHRSPGRSSGHSSPSTSHAVDREQVTNLINENKWLRIKLYRALGSCDEETVEALTTLNTTELIAEINKLKQDLDGLAAIKDRIEALREGRNSGANSDAGWQEKEVVLDEEIKKLKREVTVLREDCASYLKDTENKNLEILNLKQELAKAQKSTEDGKSRVLKPRVMPLASRRTVSTAGPTAVPLGKTVTLVPKAASSPRPSSATGPNSPSTAAASKSTAAADKSPPKRGAVGVGAAKGRSTTTTSKTTTITTSKSISPAVASRTVTKTEVTHSNSSAQPAIKTRTVKSASAATTTTVVTSINGRASAVPHAKSDDSSSSAKAEAPAADDAAVENFRQNVAAKKIQKSWKESQQQKNGGGANDAETTNGEEGGAASPTDQGDGANGTSAASTPEDERQAKLDHLRQSGAARTIQKNWKAMKKSDRHDQDDDDDDEMDEVVTTIQSAARGHYERNGSLGAMSGADEDPDHVRREQDQPATNF